MWSFNKKKEKDVLKEKDALINQIMVLKTENDMLTIQNTILEDQCIFMGCYVEALKLYNEILEDKLNEYELGW